MAHEITHRNTELGTVIEAAFLGGGRSTWHGLGGEILPGMSVDELLAVANMQHSIEEAPVLFMVDGVLYKSDTKKMQYRSIDKRELGIVGTDYQTVQYRTLVELTHKICEQHKLDFDALFTLFDGRRFVCQARIPAATSEIVTGDKVETYLSFSTSCDGSLKTHGNVGKRRVVCNNTLMMMLSDKDKKHQSWSHKSEFDPQSAADAIGFALEQNEAQTQVFQKLQAVTLDTKQAAAILADIFGKPLAKREKDKLGQINLSKPEQKILELFDGAAIGFEMVGQTAWGLLNSVTEWTDHHYGRTDDARLNSQMFGPNANLKAKALETVSSILTSDYMKSVDEAAKAFA